MSLQLLVAKSGYSCAFFGEESPDEAAPGASTEATPLAIVDEGFGLDAVLEGFLRDNGVCLTVSFGEGSSESAIVFSGQGNPRYISENKIAFDGGTITIGNRFQAVGGAITPADTQDYDPAGFGVPEECDAAENGLYLLDGLIE